MEEISLIYDTNPKRISRKDVDGISIKYVPSTNELYAASIWGDIYSFSAKKDGCRLGSTAPNGYQVINILFDNGERKMCYIHRIILETFKGIDKDRPCVNHINEIKNDNRLENLEWVTAKDNCNSGEHNKKLAESLRSGNNNRRPIKVLVYNLDTLETLFIGHSIFEAAKFINASTGNSVGAIRVQISKLLAGYPGFNTVAGFGIRQASDEEYKDWIKKNNNEISLDLSAVPVGKLNKLENLVMTTRKLDPKTGKMRLTNTVFSEGDKIINHLQ